MMLVKMIQFSLIFSTFLLVLVAELGDKTQIVAFSLTTSSGRPATVFLATSLALVLSTVTASLIGGFVSKLVPRITGYISAALFIGFGIFILARWKAEKLQDAFINSITLEKSCIRILKKIDACEEISDSRIRKISCDERSHFEIFEMIMKERLLFHSKIEDTDELEQIIEKLQPCRWKRGDPSPELLDRLIEREEASIAFYRLLLDHLDRKHRKSEEVRKLLSNMIAEEEEHRRVYLQIKEEMGEES